MIRIRLRLLILSTLGFLLILTGAESFAAGSGERAMPGQSAELWRHGPSVTAPITWINGLPFIKLSINGHKGELFLIDSGLDRTMLNSDEAARLKIKLSPKPIGYAQGLGDNDGQPMWAATGIKLRNGREKIAKGSIFATSLTMGEHCSVPKNIAGILGYDILRAHTAVIDYPNGKFMIFAKDSFVPRTDRNIQELSVDPTATQPVISVAIAVDGKDYGNARVVLDTGSATGATLYARFAASHSINELAGWKTEKYCALGGYGVTLHGLPGMARIGQAQVALSDVEVMVNKNGLAQSELYDALLGSAVLKRWSVVFDAPNGKIYLLDRDNVPAQH
jgi:predicted aspartyl protease